MALIIVAVLLCLSIALSIISWHSCFVIRCSGLISSILRDIWFPVKWVWLPSNYSTSSLIIIVVCCAVFLKNFFNCCPVLKFVGMHGRKKMSTILFNVSICYINVNYADILTDIKVQSTNFASTSFFLIDKFLTREVTINLSLYIISYHYNLI